MQLLVLGPADSHDEDAHRAGKWYDATAVALHEDCIDTHLAEAEPDSVLEVTALLAHLDIDWPPTTNW